VRRSREAGWHDPALVDDAEAFSFSSVAVCLSSVEMLGVFEAEFEGVCSMGS